MRPANVQIAANMIAYPNLLYLSTKIARVNPNIDANIGDGALNRFAWILVKPSDFMIVAPQVASPLIDWRPLRQTRRYGHVTQLVSTSMLLMISMR